MTLQQKANLLRKWSIISTTEAGSGHPTSCLSAADLMSVLFDKYYTFDLKNSRNLANDRLIFSKGHAAPLFYSLYAAAGAIPFEQLKDLRTFASPLEGHPTPHFEYTEAATGSLGQGLSVGAGMALGLKKIKKLKQSPHVYVLLGDGELAEGQVWEAANFASYYKLNNLVAIADINRMGQTQETMFGHNIVAYENRFKSFGWKAVVIDGHNFKQIETAFQTAVQNITDKPIIIIAKTHKGQGISWWEDKPNFHSKPMSKEDLPKALKELGDPKDEVIFALQKPVQKIFPPQTPKSVGIQVDYHKGEEVMPKEVYGKALVKVGEKYSQVVGLDGDVKNSDSAQDFFKTYPERFVESFIAEQNMVSVAVGLSKLGFVPYISTFSAFFTRGFDQIRMARLSEATLKIVGSYAGVSLGKDGTSQMGLEDLAMIGALPDTTILYPADATATEKLVGIMAGVSGISYLRIGRPKVKVIYENKDTFIVGGSKVLRKSTKDIVTIVAAGVTLHEALKAYEMLKKQNILVRVVDLYSVKPLDKKTLLTSASETKKKILITVEDHFLHGGLGDFVLQAVAGSGIHVEKMAVTHISHSGTEQEVLEDAGIDASAIVKKVKELLKSK